MDHLLLVLPDEITSQGHHTGRKFVIDAAAGCTQCLDSAFGPGHPSPVPFVIDRTALRADRTLMQLLLALVGVENVVLLGASRDAPRLPWVPRP